METEDEDIKRLKASLDREEAILAGMERKIEPQREKVRRLRAGLAAMQTGTFGSRSVSDHEIVAFVAQNSNELAPMSSTAIAEGMDLDTRGLSRRLPRMAKDGLIHGSPDLGYWVSHNGDGPR